ncbi:MAG TPA: hypothetical protein VMG12_11495 [Polyangiaceae bacterium]|nr:hypothetical protein [Polyangiaceae bacterium]
MTTRDDILAGALRQLREASNPSDAARRRVLASVQVSGSGGATLAAERLPPPGAALSGPSRSSMVARRSLAGGLVLGLAAFGIGVGVGIGVGFGLWRGSVDASSADAAPSPVLALPAPAPGAPSASAPAEAPIAASSLTPLTPAAPPQRASRPKPRARASAARIERVASSISLSEALQLLHRAERAIYSGNAAWAVSLLDDLDERAPAALLHEERVATRILAWCGDGQVERAEQLASQARKEAPSSIYGAILERPCAARVPASSSAASSSAASSPGSASEDSTRP